MAAEMMFQGYAGIVRGLCSNALSSSAASTSSVVTSSALGGDEKASSVYVPFSLDLD